MNIPFNKPYMTGKELKYIGQAHDQGQLAGDGAFTKRCHSWLEDNLEVRKALLTHSCTAALEMAAILADIQPGDEVIMPSYTFVSTANAFVLRGGVPVFVDIRSDTLNLDESLIEAAITKRTRAIVPVHYAGVACEMDTIMEIASRYDLLVIEDAAQGIMASYKGRPLGSIGHMGCLSFHETKNIISGEGGSLLINDRRFVKRAEIIREKGTNRSQFFRGEVDKYTWCDVGSSYLPGEIISAFLWAQLEKAKEITEARVSVFDRYRRVMDGSDFGNLFCKPVIPKECEHNGHLFYLLAESSDHRNLVIKEMRSQGVNIVFHYVPLHSSTAGIKHGIFRKPLPVTEDVSKRLFRLPCWIGVDVEEVGRTLALVTNRINIC